MAYGLSATACGGYQAGTLEGMHARQFHCVDVHVEADPRSEEHRLVLALEVGNRCREPVDLDFAAIRVAAGHSAVLEVHDPNGELSDGALDGRRQVEMALQYFVPEDLRPVEEVCVFFDGFADGADADPLCFPMPEEPSA